mmetsp:Transcript_23036/g.34304  ORF Transcript_23036/g.34304 Transcript_23036/m.34304 type:complete len:901 (-) Transcript_23036:113-2815(-)|eukprot:CAMPEP_0203677856 /NCGR_PEP_ID=MMETSP0090-20130426/29795_1 /ASSEMBLY_ACC=CAM_ASM_001088 /TAXON_ID=426623 /ORGANISM="Chaetoceros affinis, Strain CCMP159" /LENGTH=900 /DNA_ID=CAMNT_0050544879 /DNA_START=83 /DNA_END=2785 /DNA_ORIENTATION=+
MSSTSHNISNNNADNSGSITTATLNVSVPGATADNIRTKNIYTSISTTCTSSLLPLSSCLDPCSTDVLRQPAEKQHRQEDSSRNAMNTDSARFHGEISEEQDNDDDDEGENGLNHPEEGSKSIKRMTNGENDASNSLSSFSASAHERISSYGPLHIQHVHEHENRHPPPLKLTLSAYRKPESAVRLTSAPPNRLLSHDYDLKVQVAHSPSSSSSSPSPSNNNSSSNIKKDNNNNSRILGHGASSTVRLARHRRTNQKVAVKCIGKHLILRNHLFQKKFRSAANTSGSNSNTKATANTKPVSLEECELLKLIRGRHENIINLLDVYETDNEVQMVMEYCAGGELYDDIITRRRRKKITSVSPKKTNASDNIEDDKSNTSSTSTTSTTAGYTEAQAAQIARQMLSALSYLHSNGIVHRDVKPENILLVSDDPSDLTVKLSDFGLARILPEVNVDVTGSGTAPLTPPGTRSRAYSRVGSDYYAAPEVTFGSGGYGTAVDVYSLGVTLYILLSGVPPASKHQPRCGSFVLDGSCGCGDDEDVDDSSYDSECSSPSLSSYSSSEEDLTHDKVSVNVPKDHGTSTCSTTTRKLKNKTKRVPPIDFPSKQWSNISNCAKDLIRRMLHPDPNLRIQAQDALQHEWILSYGNQNQHNQMYKQYLLYPRLDQQEQLEKLQHPLRYNQKLKINTASKPPTTTAFSPLSFSTTGFSDNPKSSSVLPKLKWSFFNSNNLEQKKKKRQRPVNEANADGDERDSSEQKRKCANKKMKTTSRGRRPSIDFRIPPPKNVPISMVELYHRMSSAAAAATVVTGTNNTNPNSTPTKNNCNEKKAVVLQRQPQHQVNVNVNGPVDSVSGDCDSDSDMSSSNSDAKAAVKQQQPQQQRQKQQQQQQKPPCFTNSGALALSV